MPDIGTVRANYLAETGSFNRNTSRASRLFQRHTLRMQRSARGFNRSLNDGLLSSTALSRGIGALIGSAGLLALTRRSIEAADSIAKVSDKVGLGTDDLQAYRFAASRAADVTSQQLDIALQRFSRRVGEAFQGTGELKDTLSQYGIAVADAEGNQRPLNDVLEDYADAVAGAGSEQEQLRLAFKAFDSEGAALVNLFREGSAGIGAYRDRLNDLGGVLDEVTIRKAVEAKDKLTDLSTVFDTKLTASLLNLVPILEAVSGAVLGLVDDFSKIGQLFVADDEKTLDGFLFKLGVLRLQLKGLRATQSFLGFGGEDEIARVNAEIVKVVQQIQALKAVTKPPPKIKIETEGADPAELARIGKFQKTLAGLNFQAEIAGLDEFNRELATKAKELQIAVAGVGTGLEIAATQQAAMEIDQLREALQKIQDATDAARVIEETTTAAERHAQTLSRLTELRDRDKISAEQYARAVDRANDELAAQDERLREARELFEATRTPLEVLNEKYRRYNELLRDGLINQETFNRALAQAKEEFEDAKTGSEDVGDAVEETKDAFGDFAKGSIKDIKNVEDAVARLGDRLLDMALNNIIDITLGTGSNQGGSVLGDLFGSVAGFLGFGSANPATGGGLASFSASGGAAGVPVTAAVGLASGGPVTGTGTSTSDSNVAFLSKGEFVMRAAAVKKAGLPTMKQINRTGMVPRFQDGGPFGDLPGAAITPTELREANQASQGRASAGSDDGGIDLTGQRVRVKDDRRRDRQGRGQTLRQARSEIFGL